MARAMFAAVAVAVLLVAPGAVAQNAGIAERLFLEGKTLMQEKKYELACEKLKASHDLDKAATGTLLNLALCHELTNRPATAWAEFRQVAAESAGRREDRAAVARAHEAKLTPILSWIKVVVPPEARLVGLSIQLDKGLAIPEATWGTELPVDPGKHSLAAAAPGKVAKRIDFVVGDVGHHQDVAVEPLPDAPVETTQDLAVDRAARRQAARTRRGIGYAVGGAGLAAIGVGLVFGLVAANRNVEAKELCPSGRCSNPETKEKASSTLASADNAASISNVVVVAGSLTLAGGIVLVLTALSGSTTAPASSWRAVPMAFARGGGLAVGGEF